MESSRLDDYISAWLVHPHAGSAEGADALRRLTALMAADITYEDVPSGMLFRGHKGIAEMCTAAHQWSADLAIRVTSTQTNGSAFAFETVTEGSHTGSMGEIPATGRPFSLRGVSVGRLSAEGLVAEQRDYWDLMGFLRQIGVIPR